ncbi:MAG: efflux RND transporter periplasmic adaptor subunit [Rhabdochlamydiaceae bacterium]|nr:efflux RND transporter periplasmic adaptor subunit [Rhabdochlamydiaceae bacterium]
MKRKGFIFILAAVGIASSVWAIKRGSATPPPSPLIVAPAEKPHPKAIAAAGIIESFGENIHVGAPENGVVQEVYVKVLDTVKKGTPLFKLDTRSLESDLKVAEAKLKVSEAQLSQLEDQLARLRSIKDTRAVSSEEIRTKEHSCFVALATKKQMEQEKERIAILIDRLTIKSPIDGVVLKKNIQSGEYLLASNSDLAPFVVGNTRLLQIRTDIDEHNASVSLGDATAFPKNNPNLKIPLKYFRTEPYVVPKISLTGSSKEKVDTRVLQVIYTFEPPKELNLFVGQQVDVYIERGASQ